MKKLAVIVLIVVSLMIHAAGVQAAVRIAQVKPRATPIAVRIVRAPAKAPSLLSKIWSSVGAGVLGSVGVVAGAGVAWYTLNKKKKLFSVYYEQIKGAQQRFSAEHNKENFKKELTLIQEDAELTAAQKKLDQEQLTAIINKIDRMMKEVSSS
jgi:hypothetical protein